jgi:hypothetical protein
MQNPHKVMRHSGCVGREKASAKAGLKSRQRGWAVSGHRDGDEGQQKHQDGTGQRQDDGHHWDDGIDRILFNSRHIMGVCIMVGMVNWLRHGGSWVFEKIEVILPLWE